jgi:hypothetical protein
MQVLLSVTFVLRLMFVELFPRLVVVESWRGASLDVDLRTLLFVHSLPRASLSIFHQTFNRKASVSYPSPSEEDAS